MSIEAGAVRAQVEKIIKSETFSRSERARDLLAYLVDKKIKGEDGELKGFTIAQDVFDRDDDFDPATDAVVRVQAGRLRDLLANYYSTEGAGDGIDITVPRGTYVPVFSERDAEPVASQPVTSFQSVDFHGEDQPFSLSDSFSQTRAASQPPVADNVLVSPFVVRNIRRFWLTLLLILGMLALTLGVLWKFGSDIRRQTEPNVVPSNTVSTSANTQSDSITDLPSVTIVFVGASSEALSKFWIQELENAALRFSSVSMRQSQDTTSDYTITIAADGQQSARLAAVHNRTGSLIWSGNVHREEVAADFATYSVGGALSAILPVSGAIYADAAKRGSLAPLAHCHWQAEAYFSRQSADRFVSAYDCHKGLDGLGVVSPLLEADLASLLVERVVDNYAYPENASLDEALLRARRSLEIEQTANGYRALASVFTAQGDRISAENAASQALAVNPFDINQQAAYGYTLLQSGAYDASADMLSSAVKQVMAAPTWWSYALFTSAFLSDDLEKAALGTVALAGNDRPHYVAARLIVAHHNGAAEEASALREMLMKANNGDPWDASAYYSRFYPPEMVAKLINALREAGYDGASG